MKIYYHDNEPSDSRLPHATSPTLPASILAPLGIRYDFCSPNDIEESSADAADFSKEVPHLSTSYASYANDIITISPASMGDAYEAQIHKFYQEHMHDDEEIRWILEGSGYFDVRDADDRWVRIEVQKEDVLTLPAGIYHRFTVDEKNVS
ncbi:1,2-dihydroxy-3-keto-5-methylthiopentene dioxygenase [Xanthoria calcicola]